MELKKSPKADLQRKRILFLEIGFIVTLLIVIGMFAANFKDAEIELLDQSAIPVEEELIEITVQDMRQPVRQQIQVVSEVINIVKDDTKITNEPKFDDFLEDAIVVPVSSNQIGDIVDFGDEVFLIAEDEPLFQGQHMSSFTTWVQSQAVYPRAEERAGIQGRVMVKFVIEKDGSVSSIEVLSSTNDAFSKEAIRVVASSPKWTPGKQRGRPVRFGFTIPVNFRIGR